MPTYEYQCEKCRKTFDFYQSMKDEPLKVCPASACTRKTWGKGKVRRLLGTGAGLIFKGSGFYITDYRSDTYKQAAKKDVAPAAGGESGGSKPAEKSSEKTKPAEKSSEKAKPAAKSKSDT